MNYRHAFHAGNFADVHKHSVLVRLLLHLRLKPAAFHDTHAGRGGTTCAVPKQPGAVSGVKASSGFGGRATVGRRTT